jgi:hypothetical protein
MYAQRNNTGMFTRILYLTFAYVASDVRFFRVAGDSPGNQGRLGNPHPATHAQKCK